MARIRWAKSAGRTQRRRKKSPDSTKTISIRWIFAAMHITITILPRATAHIPQMIRIVEELIANGHALYRQWRLLRRHLLRSLRRRPFGEYDKLKVGARLEEHPEINRNPWDFALAQGTRRTSHALAITLERRLSRLAHQMFSHESGILSATPSIFIPAAGIISSRIICRKIAQSK